MSWACKSMCSTLEQVVLPCMRLPCRCTAGMPAVTRLMCHRPACLQTLPACELTGAWMAQRAAVLNNLGYYFRARNKLDEARR